MPRPIVERRATSNPASPNVQPDVGGSCGGLVTEGRDADCRYRSPPDDRCDADRNRAVAEIRRRRPWRRWGRRLHVEPRHREFADAYDGGARGGLLPDQPAVVLARQLHPQADFDRRHQSSLPFNTPRPATPPNPPPP